LVLLDLQTDKDQLSDDGDRANPIGNSFPIEAVFHLTRQLDVMVCARLLPTSLVESRREATNGHQ